MQQGAIAVGLGLVALVGCTRQQPEPAQPPQQAVTHEVGFVVVDPPPPENGGPGPGVAPNSATPESSEKRTLDQAPYVKLKLGHFSNSTRGIGLVVDLTSPPSRKGAIPPAKIRFDHTEKIWHLDGQHGTSGRIDYIRGGGKVVLHVWDNGRMAVYVPEPAGDPSATGPIHLTRDGDADPL
jgi:hypothetical protein